MTHGTLDPHRKIFTPQELSQLLGQQHAPTDEQARVIGAEPTGTYLVTAGAGAGKTETMAARVVWLVANGYVLPEQVLGLTFTRKAAAELGTRIRARLGTLARSAFMDELSKDDPRHDILKNISPAVSTYDSYAGDILREYGLYIPIEPAGRIITDAERWMIAYDIVQNWTGEIQGDKTANTLISYVLTLSEEMDNHLAEMEDVRSLTELAIQGLDELPKTRGHLSKKNLDFLDAQYRRLEILPIIEKYRARLDEMNVMTFGQQMSKAATLVEAHPHVGEEQRRRFRVVLLDEYQDTGHSQRILLSNLFGRGRDPGLSVTAVGDPMQSIYMFRGATSSNLEKFREDFPLPGGDNAGKPVLSHKLELTTSWRNPAGVLELANKVASWSMDTGRMVSELQPRPSAPRGEIQIGFFETRQEELDWLAGELEARWKDYEQSARTTPFSAAVLVTKNKQALPVYEELIARGIPAEMTAGPGLLDLPEVADVYATLRVLVDPEDDEATMRLLTGPRFNLGAADLAVLAQRAKQIHRKKPEDTGGESPEARDQMYSSSAPQAATAVTAPNVPSELASSLEKLIPDPHAMSVGLSDAAADLTDAVEQGMSEEGARRISEFAQELGQLRRHSLSKPLPDLVADIEQMIGVRTEVMARWHRDPETSIGTSHLEKFASIVRDFAALNNSNASALVEYLKAAYDQEAGLEPGEVRKKQNVVQILTVHKAKGLEWDIVAVPFATRNNYADYSQTKQIERWTSNASAMPTELRGDAEPSGTTGDQMPIFDASTATKSSDHNKAVEEFATEIKRYASKESDRVFYVAITRTERVLLVSGSAYSPTRKSAVDPAVLLKVIADSANHDEIVEFSEAGKTYPKKFYDDVEKGILSREDNLLSPSPEANLLRKENDARWAAFLKEQEESEEMNGTVWPRRHNVDTSAVDMVESFLDGEIPPTTTAWDRETQLLIEEFTQRSTREVRVPLGIRLTATEAVALRQDSQEFARRRRRPVPLEPKPFAKRGTAFHNWVEQHYKQVSLLDEEELPGASDATVKDPQLEKLKEAFLASEWADKQPYSVEGAYSVSLAGRIYEGRIDAVFHEGDDMRTGWFVVDWKTGKKPVGQAMAAAEMQLGVYRLAWAKVLSRRLGIEVNPEEVRAAFHYVATNDTVEPRTLPTAEQLSGE
ncbi:UvrD-helicase domain-containing protein [Corynebacterium anserum]|uniref:DNA 3'-5' helicase n=1 Tax=Corynebacterium anserum TaxID=2684406 RepID=A0A7G7YPM0_9CORY|nr:UvrD-helicase domain-containing protein [Corynebacterium anserum]MBC2682076.1 UvrD-helicase domain-containing protein [Corynebacterium anserum]QNH96440.1 AAA family ATPase [Corynebacterium anserum]